MRKLYCAFMVAVASFGAPLSAQPLQCGPRAAVLDMLAAQDQSRRAIGLAGRAVMELFAAPDGGRWTITLTMPDGPMCLLANGVAYDGMIEALPMQGTAL
ncbi:MAG: hypothetical protein ACNA7L_03970 [Roseinatronobacter sp.]